MGWAYFDFELFKQQRGGVFGLQVALLTGFAFGMVMLGRLTLVVLGVWKAPVLRRFERYAHYDDTFYPLPLVFLWSGIAASSLGFYLYYHARVTFPVFLPGILLLVCAYLADRSFNVAKRFPRLLLGTPRWYAELRERTSREERRHIAYMWLGLPRSTRWVYNLNDRAFQQWADLVIVATTLSTYEEAMQNIHRRRAGTVAVYETMWE